MAACWKRCFTIGLPSCFWQRCAEQAGLRLFCGFLKKLLKIQAMAQVREIVFDLDGTLLDSKLDYESDAAHFSSLDLPLVGRPLDRNVWLHSGRAADCLIQAFLPSGIPRFTPRRIASNSESDGG